MPHAIGDDIVTMMPSEPAAGPASITLILDVRLPAVSADTPSLYPHLALLAGRGQLQHRWRWSARAMASHCRWQLSVLAALGLMPEDYPSAAVAALAASRNEPADPPGFWLHADPVHLAAGMDSLSLLSLTGSAAVTDEERGALLPVLNAHMEGGALRLRLENIDRDDAGRDNAGWLMRSGCALDIATCTAEAASAAPLDTVMPAGADARELRRLMTEWQMLLHEHPVNTLRQRRGLPAINALWPWGGGICRAVAARALPLAYADAAFVKGIYRRHDAQVRPAPVNGAALLEAVAKPTLVVLQVADLAQVECDWVAPSIAALRSGRIAALDVWIDAWHLRATRGMLRRFWRKPLPLSGWME